MIKFLTKLLVAIILVSFINPFSKADAKDGEPLSDFFAELYENNAVNFKKAYELEFQSFCKIYDVEPTNTSNQDKYFRLLFYHKMFTGTTSMDCVKGGMLQIPYFWHWIKTNPRHKILDNQSGKPLCDKKPPKLYSKYKSHADIDRTPYIYLKDMVSEEPLYRHPDCGEFYTFGWCSEREMTFSLFMGIYGYRSIINQEGPHVTTDFWIAFTNHSGKESILLAIVDNTYDVIVWKKVNGTKLDSWYNNMGNIKMVKWYNSVARSENERELVKNIRIESKAASRIEGLVKW